MNRNILPLAVVAAVAGVAAHAVAQTAAPAVPNVIGVAKAVAIAEQQLDARAFEAELDRERGALVYEMNLVKDGRPLSADVDAVTGQLVWQGKPSRLRARLPFDRDEMRAAQSAPRSLTQTIAMIEASTKGRVSDIDLERRGGRDYYEVGLIGAQDRDVLVDVRTGAITPLIEE